MAVEVKRVLLGTRGQTKGMGPRSFLSSRVPDGMVLVGKGVLAGLDKVLLDRPV